MQVCYNRHKMAWKKKRANLRDKIESPVWIVVEPRVFLGLADSVTWSDLHSHATILTPTCSPGVFDHPVIKRELIIEIDEPVTVPIEQGGMVDSIACARGVEDASVVELEWGLNAEVVRQCLSREGCLNSSVVA